MAVSSPKTRSPCSSTKSSKSSLTRSSVCGPLRVAGDLGALPGGQARVDRAAAGGASRSSSLRDLVARRRRSPRTRAAPRCGSRARGAASRNQARPAYSTSILPGPSSASTFATSRGAGSTRELLDPHARPPARAAARGGTAACGPRCSLADRPHRGEQRRAGASAAALTRIRQACAAGVAPAAVAVAVAGRGRLPIASSRGLISSASTTRPLSLSSTRPRTMHGPRVPERAARSFVGLGEDRQRDRAVDQPRA